MVQKTHFDPVCKLHHEGPNCPFDKSGFEDDPTFVKPCLNPSHEPPNMLYIEPGKQYRHVCQGCGKVTILRPPNIHL